VVCAQNRRHDFVQGWLMRCAEPAAAAAAAPDTGRLPPLLLPRPAPAPHHAGCVVFVHGATTRRASCTISSGGAAHKTADPLLLLLAGKFCCAGCVVFADGATTRRAIAGSGHPLAPEELSTAPDDMDQVMTDANLDPAGRAALAASIDGCKCCRNETGGKCGRWHFLVFWSSV
jgi:hypothetical protein